MYELIITGKPGSEQIKARFKDYDLVSIKKLADKYPDFYYVIIFQSNTTTDLIEIHKPNGEEKYKIYKHGELCKMWLTKVYGATTSWSSKFSEAKVIEHKNIANDLAYQFGGDVYTIDEEIEKSLLT